MTGFFAAKGLFGLARGAWIGIAILGLLLIAWAIIGTYDNTLDDARETGREAGASGAIIAGQEQTLDQLKDANDAEQDLRAAGQRSAAAYDDCVRNSRRGPASCERYRPLPRPE